MRKGPDSRAWETNENGSRFECVDGHWGRAVLRMRMVDSGSLKKVETRPI